MLPFGTKDNYNYNMQPRQIPVNATNIPAPAP